MENLKNAIAIKPNCADYYYLLGTILDVIQQPKEAIWAFEKFVEFSTDETLKEKIKSKTKNLYDGVAKE